MSTTEDNLYLTHIRELREAVDGVARKVDWLETRVVHLEERVDGIATRLESFAKSVSGSFKYLVEQNNALDRRVANLEQTTKDINEKLDRVETRFNVIEHLLQRLVENRDNG